jgi:hypothetical protein
MPQTKADVACKIWESEGFDYYFTQYAGYDLEDIGTVVTKKEHEKLKRVYEVYIAARQDLVAYLEEYGLGADDTWGDDED